MTFPSYFAPSSKVISQIVRGLTTEIFTTVNHNYSNGQVVHIVIPLQRGMQQLNNYIGEITVTGNLRFTIPVDSTGFDVYIPIVMPLMEQYVGQVSAIAENALTLSCSLNNNNNIIPETTGTIPINP